jgi:hypothetical protein
MKFPMSVLMLLGFAVSAEATSPPRIHVLPCVWTGSDAVLVGGPVLSVEKVSRQVGTSRKKIKVSYTLRFRPMNPNAAEQTYKLAPLYSGDEDYSDYRVVTRKKDFFISGASIQDDFEWVTLKNQDGESVYTCE